MDEYDERGFLKTSDPLAEETETILKLSMHDPIIQTFVQMYRHDYISWHGALCGMIVALSNSNKNKLDLLIKYKNGEK